MRASGAKLIACAAALTACAVALSGHAGAQDAVATLQRAATLTIPRPSEPGQVFLDLWVTAYTPPTRGAVEAVVSVGPGGRQAPVEVGRFSVFPSEPFTAGEPRKQRTFRFNATAALNALHADDKTLAVHIEMLSLIDTMAAEGARLTVGKAAFTGRP